jgi:hypothetical protein
MKPELRRALVFGLHFLILFPLCLWLYPEVLPAYQKLVVGVANLFLQAFSPALHVDVLADGGWQTFLIEAGAEPAFVYGMRPAALDLIYLNLALVPALLGATPVPATRRLSLLGWGLLLLVAFHVVAVIGLVRTWWCLQESPDDFLCHGFRGALKVSGQLFGVVQWALLTWSVWLPGRRAAPPPRVVSRRRGAGAGR